MDRIRSRYIPQEERLQISLGKQQRSINQGRISTALSNHTYFTSALASITTFFVSTYILSGSRQLLYLVGAAASFVLLLLFAMRDIKKGRVQKATTPWAAPCTALTVFVILIISITESRWIGWAFVASLFSFFASFRTSHTHEDAKYERKSP